VLDNNDQEKKLSLSIKAYKLLNNKHWYKESVKGDILVNKENIELIVNGHRNMYSFRSLKNVQLF